VGQRRVFLGNDCLGRHTNKLCSLEPSFAAIRIISKIFNYFISTKCQYLRRC
jgi:hypothetical protein